METQRLERLREDLEREEQEVVAELRGHGADPESERVSAIGVDDGFADAAAATAERAEVLAFIETARERLREVRQALARMDEGTYGRCVDCGETIPEARLQARPLSVRCVRCAEQRS